MPKLVDQLPKYRHFAARNCDVDTQGHVWLPRLMGGSLAPGVRKLPR